MLKTIALASIFVFTSAVSTIALTHTSQKPVQAASPVPTAPQPQGFCMPPGSPC